MHANIGTWRILGAGLRMELSEYPSGIFRSQEVKLGRLLRTCRVRVSSLTARGMGPTDRLTQFEVVGVQVLRHADREKLYGFVRSNVGLQLKTQVTSLENARYIPDMCRIKLISLSKTCRNQS